MAGAPTIRRALAELARRELERRRLVADLRAFLRAAWPTMAGAKRLEWDRHIDAQCMHAQILVEEWHLAGLEPDDVERTLAAWESEGRPYVRDRDGSDDDGLTVAGQREHWERPIEAGGCGRGAYVQRTTDLVVNVAPVSLKSTVWCVVLLAWIWTWCSTFAGFFASGTPLNVRRDSLATRDLVTSRWYRETFAVGWTLRGDQNRIDEWSTTAGGVRQARGTDGSVTGVHADCVVGETMIATELGDVAIEDLVLMDPMPRVWSRNHVTGEVELDRVRATRRIDNRQTIDVVVDSCHRLRCTDDHRIWTSDGYIEAERALGRCVSILSWSESTRKQRPSAVQVVHDDRAYVRDMRVDVRSRRGGTSQTEQGWDQVRPVLFQSMREVESGWAGARTKMRDVRDHVQAGRIQGDTPTLFDSMCVGEPAAHTQASRSSLRMVRSNDGDQIGTREVLLESVQECSTLSADVWDGKLELQRSKQGLLWWSLGQPAAADTRTRRQCMHGVRRREDLAGTAGASHRRGSAEQPAGEPDHALQRVPHIAPQIDLARVLSIGQTLEAGRRSTHAVYDLDVERNHNFFAGGILVHNCIMVDDPDDAAKVWSDAARRDVMNFWRAVGNRLRDPRRPLRVVLQQNVHPEDLSSRIAADGVPRLAIPLTFVEARRAKLCTAPFGWRDPRADGEQLQPTYYTERVRADELRRLGTAGYNAQYECDPSPAEGVMFRRRWWRFFRPIVAHDDAPALPPRARPEGCVGSGGEHGAVERHPAVAVDLSDLEWLELSVDATFGSIRDSASEVSLQVIGGYGANRFVFDDDTKVRSWPDTIDAVREKIRAYGVDRAVIERKANGQAVIDSLVAAMLDPDRPLVGPTGEPIAVAIEPIDPTESKESRWAAMSPEVEAGTWFLLDGAAWTRDYVDQFAGLPQSRRNDRADASSQIAAKHRSVMDVEARWRALAGMRPS